MGGVHIHFSMREKSEKENTHKKWYVNGMVRIREQENKTKTTLAQKKWWRIQNGTHSQL